MNAPWRVCNPFAADSERSKLVERCFLSLPPLKRSEGRRADVSSPGLRLERQAAHREDVGLAHCGLRAVARIRGKAIKVAQGFLAAVDVARAAMVGQQQVRGAGAAVDG